MKLITFKITNKKLFIWFFIYAIIYLGFSLYYHDFYKFYNVLVVGLTPLWFNMFFGEKIE
jgi:hypothetical protein